MAVDGLKMDNNDKQQDANNKTLHLEQSSIWTRQQKAVCVRRAYKAYGSKKDSNSILNNLDMTVDRGTIYGLLGSSGCGKTTLLSCVVGRRKLDSGEIWVLGGKPGTKGSGVPGRQVGYMPQEIALYGVFSIKETMMYFGWIFGMKTSEIKERLKFLLDLLDLPSENRLVQNLSGGQQRRVSFAVSLMHDPELLILDEPTVGVDPLLRRSIWNYLVHITKHGNKTVILTTHYIEEASAAHKIGLMRNGKLLAEESPQVLLTMYGCSSLEDVFLELSKRQVKDTSEGPLNQDAVNKNISQMSLNLEKKEEPIYSRVRGLNFHQTKEILIQHITKCCFNSFSNLTTKGKMRALLQKNFLKMFRNVGVMLFVFALPVLQTILFCLAVGRDPTGLKFAIVNEEIPNWGKGGVCRRVHSCTFQNLSCRYLQHLNNKVIQKPYRTVKLAIDAVKEGDAWGVIYFTKTFSNSTIARMALGRNVDAKTINQSEVRVWLDMSNEQIGLMLDRDLQFSYRDFVKELFSACKQTPTLGVNPIKFTDPIYGKSNPSFTDFMAPGVIISIVFFLAVSMTSSAFITERTEGLLDRAWVAGVSAGEILASHIITQFIVTCGQTALVLIFIILVFGVECQGDVFWVILLTILQGLCGMCFGFLISAVCEMERNAIQMALGSFYPTLILSGIIWPIEGMPIVLRHIAVLLPLTMATISLRSMLTRGWGITEPDVYYGFISTISWIALFLAITMIILKLKKG